MQTAYIRRRHDTVIEGHFHRKLSWWRGWWGWYSWRYRGYNIGWDQRARNGELLNRYGNYWWEWRKSTLYSNRWWWNSLWNNWAYYDAWLNYYDFYFSWQYSWGWKCVLHRYVPCCYAWHYEWCYADFKRYVIHNGFHDYNWKIAMVQHYNATLDPQSNDKFRNRWAATFSKMFGYSTPYERAYLSASTEDYELFIDDAGKQPGTLFEEYDDKYKQVISSYMTTKEHNVMDYLVDWGRGVGAHNKLMFLTRGPKDQPDCLFRCEV